MNWVDPIGLSRLTIHYTAGGSFSINNPRGQSLIDTLQSTPNNSITLFQLNGHGNSSEQCISAGTNCSDILDSNLNVLSDGKIIGNVADLLNSKLSSSGEVDLAGCNNASGNENITKSTSDLLEDHPVRGGVWYQFGYENHWLFGNSSGSFGLKKTYINGLEQ